MARHCPHLGLEGNRYQVFLVPNARHRCHAAGLPQRVAIEHQGTTCLTPAYQRCPRLLAAALEERPAPAEPIFPGPDTSRRYTDLQSIGGGSKRSRRPLTAVEAMVLGLVTCIVLAFFFVGYVIFYRFQVGPGMGAVPMTDSGAGAPAARALPSLVPTFTPTSLPTATAVEVVAAPPTPIPEPVLPLAPARPPAQSPPTRLVIHKIDLDIPVLPVEIKTIQDMGQSRLVWGDLPNAGGFHYTSAYPGNPGNTVINGHRDIQGSVFRHLDRVAVGDEIMLYVGDVAYDYVVSEILVVPETFASASQRAENQRLIGYMPEERLTLVTCTPVGLATHRLLVIARPPAPTASQVP